MSHTPSRIPLLRATGLALLLAACLPAAMADVVVIVNPATPPTLDDEQIARIFLGQTKTFPGGGEALPAQGKEGPLRDEFNEKVLKKTSGQVKSLWARQIFSGGAKPPKELDSDDAVLKFVAATPGAIGYVEAGKVNSSVKVVKR